jgi:serine/threonine protein kinase/tetratricopeptide (TPR) repeat protein
MGLAPQTLVQDRYRVVRLIGQGGMGAVYKAMDERLAHPVALKQTLPQNEQWSNAFEREARILARLRHPALVRVTDHFNNSEGQFLVMDYINGEDLATLLKQRGVPFDCATVLEWANQLLNALDYLHNENPPVIHRDIKPQNLKCSSQGQLILLDFGLAKGWSGSDKHIITEKSLFGYTPQYAPFEQIQGLGTDTRSDLFALAATLYHLLGGNPPVNAVQRTNAIMQNKIDPLPLLHDINPMVPLAVSQVIHQALRLERRNRPASAAVLRDALQKASQQPAPNQYQRVVGGGATALHTSPASSPALPAALSAAPTFSEGSTVVAPASSPSPSSPPAPSGAVPAQRQIPTAGKWHKPLIVMVAILLLLAGVAVLLQSRFAQTPNGSTAGQHVQPTPAAHTTQQQAASTAPQQHVAVSATATLPPATTAASHTAGSTTAMPTYPIVKADGLAVDYYNQGAVAAQQGDYRTAIAMYSQAIAHYPDFPTAYFGRAIAYNHQGNYANAIADYEQAIKLYPFFLDAYRDLGILYNEQAIGAQDYEQAIHYLSKALEFQPDSPRVFYHRGKAYSNIGEYTSAITDFTTLLQTEPEDPEIYNLRGLAYLNNGAYEQALADFNQVIALDRSLDYAYSNRGLVYQAIEQHEKALTDFTHAIRLRPNDASGYYHRAVSFIALEDYEQAERNFTQAITLDHGFSQAYVQRGLAVYYRQHDYERAIQDLSEVLRIDPHSEDAYAWRALCLLKIGKPDQAMADINEAFALNPNSAGGYYVRGLIHKEKGRNQQAIADLETYLEVGKNPAHLTSAEQALEALQR